MASKVILIVGGGIAGSAAAIALARAGIESIVYDASPAPRDDEGAFFNLAPNGIAVLRALDIEFVLDSIGFRNDRLIFQNERGRVLAETAVGGVTVMRGALSRRLRQVAQQRRVRFVFGKPLDTVRRHGEMVAHFADGTSVVASAVIGADGTHSRTRASLLPDAPRPAYTGIINLGGVAQTDLTPTGSAMQMVFGRRAFFGYAVRASGETYWFSNYAQRTEPERGTCANLPAGAMRDRLLALHRDDPPEVSRILQTLSGSIGAYPIYDLPPLPSWQRGAVCLIGDAAHAIGPHVGQGASLALEDAFIVAKCLRDHGDPAIAFSDFERLRRGRVEPVVRQSRRTGQQKAPSGWMGRKIRDLMLPMFLRKAVDDARQLYAYTLPAWEEPLPTIRKSELSEVRRIA